jgi:hypothetical protein
MAITRHQDDLPLKNTQGRVPQESLRKKPPVFRGFFQVDVFGMTVAQ